MQLTIIIEKGDGEIWGRVEAPGFLNVTVGNSEAEITQNMLELIEDFLENEGKEDEYWKGVTLESIEFDYRYDLTAFFDLFSPLKINSIAEKAGINKALLRQYVSGVKHPSAQQVQKIESAIHAFAQNLMKVSLV
jgi:predicted RNase H-like HicB family nuclease